LRRNYAEHAKEMKHDMAGHFMKPDTALKRKNMPFFLPIPMKCTQNRDCPSHQQEWEKH
jgi:hypothetical protein